VKKKIQRIKRLEQGLQWWEDAYLFCGSGFAGGTAKRGDDYKEVDLEGVLQFRAKLIESFGEELDCRKFFLHSYEEGSGRLRDSHLPIAMEAWNRCSRRVYQVPNDLRALLKATSLGRVQWDDVLLPFNAFAVILDEPLVDNLGCSYDCFIIAKSKFYSGKPSLVLMFYSTALARNKPISNRDREKVKWAVRKGRWKKIEQVAKRGIRDAAAPTAHHLIPEEVLKQGSIEQALQTAPDDYHLPKGGATDNHDWGLTSQALRLVCGLSVCLQMLPTKSGSKPKGDDQPKAPPLNTGLITDGADICTVSVTHVLGSCKEQRGTQGQRDGIQRRKSTHFRTGFWRKPPGTASDPNQKKTVKVPSTIVNLHLLPEGAIPHGSENVVKE